MEKPEAGEQWALKQPWIRTGMPSFTIKSWKESWKYPFFTALVIVLVALVLQDGLERPAYFSDIFSLQGARKGGFGDGTLPKPPKIAWGAIPKLPKPSKLGLDKWVVITSINPPTLAVETIVGLKDWQLLVVGDTKSPKNWSLPGAIFLSVEEQLSLGYRILKDVPYRSYARKNVGYLYAIQHGAKVIYETDDDNILTALSIEAGFDVDSGRLQRAAARGKAQQESTGVAPLGDGGDDFLQYARVEGRQVVNPYVHFGQPSVWPRGYPLEEVAENFPEKTFDVVPKGRELIQQGLANGDPDVDAIFRLTRRQNGQLIRFVFDSEAPPVGLPEGVMAPFNSQNTLFHTDALWGLLIPTTTAFRVCDIWRGYWAQRLLWEVGGTLSFFPPSVRQDRNVHNYFDDFVDESALYRDSGRLVRFLLSWRSDRPHFFDRVLELSYAMSAEGFWGIGDAELSLAWLQDLVSLGYDAPPLQRPPTPLQGRHRTYQPKVLPSSLLAPDSKQPPALPPGTMSTTADDQSSLRQSMNTPRPGSLASLQASFGDVVIIINYNFPKFQSVLFWRMIYGRFCKSVVVMCENASIPLGVMGVNGSESGWQTYRALPDVFQRFPDASGFLLVNDDVILNYWNLVGCDKNKIWHTLNCTACEPPWNIFNHSLGQGANGHANFWRRPNHYLLQERAVHAMPSERQAQYRKAVPPGFGIHAVSDVYYVPQRFVGGMSELIPIFAQRGVRSEMAIPAIMFAIAGPADFDAWALSRTVYIWGQTRYRPPSTSYNTDIHALHPWKPRNELVMARILRSLARGDENLKDLVSSMSR